MATSNGGPCSSSPQPDYDVLIVGAGFAGIFLLHQLRNLGYRCKIYEAGTDIGGVWHWNTYPGARVDSECAIYQLSIPEVWRDWKWSQLYPDRHEIQSYFRHIDQVLNVKKDVEFRTRVIGAQFDKEHSQQWKVETDDGRITTCRFLLLCAGLASKRYTPDFPGLESFRGEIHHSSFWPKEGVDAHGKRVAVIGTGSSGVQIIQAWGKEAASLTVFQRTPNLALPMAQKTFTEEDHAHNESLYPQIFQDRETTFSGYMMNPIPKKTFDVSPEEREAIFESLWQEGGFAPILAGFMDNLLDWDANRALYDFWARKTRARIQDERLKDILAPLKQMHAFGAKRCSLELDYYEQFNKPNVTLVNLRECSITAIEPDGIRTSDGSFHPVDVIALATGFDGITGSMTNIEGLRNTDGVPLANEWKDGAKTHLGMTIKGYPNMFFTLGAHAPSGFSNGPTSIEIQGRWIVDAIRKIDSSGLSYIEPTAEAEAAWKAQVNMITDMTLLGQADSWYMGANIPGKKREMLNYAGGLPLYEQQCRKALESWEGFITV
ncbi:putative flavo protein [Paecilomyces variotii]|uniref:Putative flavo protein n=1 Tax=Byssochlamys spectabilis TaxID=264951 RepID=A0A443HJA6_BYSSP|nr:putative flavo protein [Paecilomyces variotii]KAJ9248519.1 hypothetical protein DTO207G8_7298 [Paecilomyces variotii]KAJ9361192.1 hypothetical protein DTO280E4_3939 [Paecilomyces variotii]RWQ91922.1 putative flavo protein [Paecilomyces variotii]